MEEKGPKTQTIECSRKNKENERRNREYTQLIDGLVMPLDADSFVRVPYNTFPPTKAKERLFTIYERGRKRHQNVLYRIMSAPYIHSDSMCTQHTLWCTTQYTEHIYCA